MLKRNRITLFSVFLVFGLVAVMLWQVQEYGGNMMPYSPLVKNNEASNTLNYVNMNFLDKVSGQSPSKISVTVYSNNGRICDTIPCDNNYKFWQAVTDASGNIYVPVDYVQLATTVILDGYKESVLRYDKAKNVYTISVEPNAPNTDDFVINP